MKIIRGERELSLKDVEEIPKGIIPGEWVCLVDAAAKKKYLSYVNPHADIFYKIKILKTADWSNGFIDFENKIGMIVTENERLNHVIAQNKSDYEARINFLLRENESLRLHVNTHNSENDVHNSAF